MSSNWPDKPLIHIIRGEINGKPIANKIATRTEGGNFALAWAAAIIAQEETGEGEDR